MSSQNLGSLTTTTLILLFLGLAVFFDLKTKKIPNRLVLVTLVVSVIWIFISQGLSGWLNIVISFCAAMIFLLPLYLTRAVGAGDIKLILALSPLLDWQGLLLMILFSLIWGGLLGILRVVLRKEWSAFSSNLKMILVQQKPNEKSLHTMPYSIAIFFGYLSMTTLQTLGVTFL